MRKSCTGINVGEQLTKMTTDRRHAKYLVDEIT